MAHFPPVRHLLSASPPRALSTGYPTDVKRILGINADCLAMAFYVPNCAVDKIEIRARFEYMKGLGCYEWLQ